MSYVPLWCKSNFSFLEGASHPDELIGQAHALGIPALALTDRDGVHGVVRAHVKARELGVSLIVGAEVTVGAEAAADAAADAPGIAGGVPIPTSTCVLLAMNRTGYANLCRLITTGRLRRPKGESCVTWPEVCARADGLIALWGGNRSLLIRDDAPRSIIASMRDAFGDRLYAMVTRHRRAEEVRQEASVRRHAERASLPLVAATEVLYHAPARRELQDVLTCIGHGVVLAAAGRLTRPNAEHDLKAPEAMAELFADEPALVERTREVASRCAFDLSRIRYRYPAEKLPDGKTSAAWLRELTLHGAHERFAATGGVPPAIREQIDRELALIDELDYGGYFLTMWEIVRYCRQEGILCQGRGSAANSVVCYCLGITAVDPTRVELLFERFLSRERHEPPDIDLDIMHVRREEVIRHVYRKYGRDRAAMVANVVRYRGRSAVREVGKALGLSETAVDRLAKLLSHHGLLETAGLARHAGLDPASPLHDHLFGLCAQIQDFPRHLSIHPGGFLLGHEPVHDLVPIENATMPGRTVVQWDKHDLEDLGLFKVDLLGLGALTQLDLGFRLIERHHGRRLSLDRLPPDDSDTYDMNLPLRHRRRLPDREPRPDVDAAAAQAPQLLRPGHRGEHRASRPDHRRDGPSVSPAAKQGGAGRVSAPVPRAGAQQDARRAALPGAGDEARGGGGRLHAGRGRSASPRHGGVASHRADRPAPRSIGDPDDGQGDRQGVRREGVRPDPGIRGLRVPREPCGELRADRLRHGLAPLPLPGGVRVLAAQRAADGVLHAGHHRRGRRPARVEVRPVDVTASAWDCTLEPLRASASRPAGRARTWRGGDPGVGARAWTAGGAAIRGRMRQRGGGAVRGRTATAPDGMPVGPAFAVRMGLRYVKSLSEERDWRRIEAARAERTFASMEDFTRRTWLDARIVRRLAEAGAFAWFEGKRRTALWEALDLGRMPASSLPLSPREPRSDFEPLGEFETIAWDYRFTAHSTRGHPLAPLRDA